MSSWLRVMALAAGAPEPSDLEQVLAWMSGSFSSHVQPETDPDDFDIRLEMVPIWLEGDGGPWLYAEQAAAGSLERPYRQRVYRLIAEPDGRVRSQTCTLPEPLAWAGALRQPERFQQLTPQALEQLRGCEVVLERRADGNYEGGTQGQACASELRGASWASSHVTLGSEGMESWDRGWNQQREQVWGVRKGPYLFLREASPAAAAGGSP